MKLPKPNFKIDYVPLAGGEDLITPSLSVKPGKAILTHNYELDVHGRYRLIDGYEVYDGHQKPSDASYWVLPFDQGKTEIKAGDTISTVGYPPSETAIALVYLVVVTSGTWAGGDAAGYLVIYYLMYANFLNNDDIAGKALVNGSQVERGAPTDRLDSEWLLAITELHRALIGAVPGNGSVLGVWQLNGVKYAFRVDATNSFVDMYWAGAIGWNICDLGERLTFTLGTNDFVEGEVLTRSGVTSTVRRVVVKSGTWAGGNAAGYFVIYGRAGGNYSTGTATGSSGGSCRITGPQTANHLYSYPGHFEFVNYRFSGNAETRMYGCDGLNKAFEWDGAYFTPIETGMTVDTPQHIAVHKNHLFLSFAQGSVQHSSLGAPYLWSAVTGAGEIMLNDENTGFLSLQDVLACFTRNSTYLLYGSSSLDWDLKRHSDEAGAIEWTPQKIGTGIYLDDRGITSLAATDKYGDFASNALSRFIQPYLKTKMALVQSSVRVKEKNQYRLFFTDMRALTLTVDGENVVGFSRQFYDKLPVCVCSVENSTTGREEIYFGSTDGFVYQMDAGTTFNGNPIQACIKFHFNNLKSPTIKKRIRRIILEIDAPSYTYLSANVEFDYGETINVAKFFDLESPSGMWDIENWDDFVWNGRSIASAPLDVDGTGQNFSLTIYHSGIFELQAGIVPPRTGITGAPSHTIQGYIVHYDVRGVQR